MAELTAFDGLVSSIGRQIATVWAAPLPFLMVLALSSVTIWKAMEWLYRGQIKRLENDAEWTKDQLSRLRDEKISMDHASLKTNTQEIINKSTIDIVNTTCSIERNFLPSNISALDLSTIKMKSRSITRDRYLSSFIGMWTNFDVTVSSTGILGKEVFIRSENDEANTIREAMTGAMSLYFNNTSPRIEALLPGDRVSGIGMIESIDLLAITLVQCELN